MRVKINNKNKVILNFRINKNVYRDISNEAKRHHISIHKEINNRLKCTLNPKYKYKNNKILMNVALQTLEEDGYNQFMCFDYPIAEYELDVIEQLKDCDDLNKEICLRIAYTLHDPFYE